MFLCGPELAGWVVIIIVCSSLSNPSSSHRLHATLSAPSFHCFTTLTTYPPLPSLPDSIPVGLFEIFAAWLPLCLDLPDTRPTVQPCHYSALLLTGSFTVRPSYSLFTQPSTFSASHCIIISLIHKFTVYSFRINDSVFY